MKINYCVPMSDPSLSRYFLLPKSVESESPSDGSDFVGRRIYFQGSDMYAYLSHIFTPDSIIGTSTSFEDGEFVIIFEIDDPHMSYLSNFLEYYDPFF